MSGAEIAIAIAIMMMDLAPKIGLFAHISSIPDDERPP